MDIMKPAIRLFPILMLTAFTAVLEAQTYYGAIDVGSKGTKAALFSFVKEAEGRDARVIFGRSINTKLVSSMENGQFTPAGIDETTDAVKQLIDNLKAEAAKQRIPKVGYLIVGSSGVAKAKNKEMLAAAIKGTTGIDMDFVDVRREGYFGLLSAVPLRRRPVSMFLDTGSGNTKLGCLVGDTELNNFRSSEVPYGSVSGRKKGLEKNPKDIADGIAQVMREEVGPAYEKESMDTPCLRNRPRIYWTGGAAWATASFTHPEHSLDGWVIVTRADLDNFLARLKDGSWNQRALTYAFAPDIPAKRQAEIRARAEKERLGVMDVFVREDLLSGVSIMKTILESSNQKALIQFVRDGNFLYGYVREKFKLDTPDGGTH